MRAFGIILLIVGILMTIFTGFNLVTEDEVLDVGPVKVKKEEKTPIYWSPATGGVLILAGVVIIILGKAEGNGLEWCFLVLWCMMLTLQLRLANLVRFELQSLAVAEYQL